MRIAISGKPDDGGMIPAAKWDTIRRAEEALQRARCWSHWMQAAEESQRDRGSSAYVLTAGSGESWTE